MKKIIANRFRVLSKIYSDGTDLLYNVSDEINDNSLKTLHMIRSSQVVADTSKEKNHLIQKLKGLHHPNLISVDHKGVTEEGFPYYCIAPWSEKAKLLETKQITSSTMLELIFQLCHAISYLHRNGIVHGNLKPSNLFRAKNTLKVIGYGAALSFQENETITCHLSKDYSAPELFDTYSPNPLTDLYSIGAIAFDLFTGNPPPPPPPAPDKYHENKRILAEAIDAQYEIPAGVSGVIHRLLSHSHQHRFQSANETLLTLSDVVGKPYLPKHTKYSHILTYDDTFNPYLNRQEEVQSLIEKARDERCHTIVISGARGVGKTHLFYEVFKDITSRKGVVIQGFCIQEKRVAYRPIREILRQLIPLLVKAHSGRLPLEDHQCAVLATLIPELLDAPYMEGISPPAELDHDDARQRMNHVIYSTLRIAAEIGPTSFFIHNLQWADEATIALCASMSLT